MPAQTLIQSRRGTAALWTSTNPTLAAGERGYETDTGREKVGDGTHAWTALPYTLDSVASKAEVARVIAGPVTAGLLGNSIEWQCDVDTPNGVPRTAGYVGHCNIALGHPFAVVVNAGVIGDTTAQMLARLTAITGASPKPAVCFVGACENDDIYTASQSIANLTAIYEGLISAGIQPIAHTTLPYAGKGSAWRANHAIVDRWMKVYSRQRGFPVIDAFAVLADPATGDPKTGVTRDGLVHPNWQGAAQIGKAAATELARWFPNTIALGQSNDDTGNLVVNGMMLGGTTTPTSWTYYTNGTATTTRTKVPRLDIPGAEWWQSAISVGGQHQLYQNISTGFAVGDTIRFSAEFQTDLDTIGSYGAYFAVNFTGATGAFQPCADLGWGGSGSGDSVPPGTMDCYPRSGVMASQLITIPPGTTALQPMLVLGSSCHGTFRIGRVEIRKATV